MDYYEFYTFWNAYNPDETRFPNRRAATFREWQKKSEKARQAMLEAVKKDNGALRRKNPFFFVQNFTEDEPTFLKGNEAGDLVQVRHNGLFKICTRDTMRQFGLEYVRDWLPAPD